MKESMETTSCGKTECWFPSLSVFSGHVRKSVPPLQVRSGKRQYSHLISRKDQSRCDHLLVLPGVNSAMNCWANYKKDLAAKA